MRLIFISYQVSLYVDQSVVYTLDKVVLSFKHMTFNF